MHNQLDIYHYDIIKDVLGFGSRLVIWFNGCPFRCPGCIEEKLQSGDLGRSISTIDLLNELDDKLPKVDGLTLSGGEPLWQSVSLLEFLDLVPRSLDKMLFTGYNVSELNSTKLECYNRFDLVISGRFQQSKMGNYLWRGSANQTIVSPTGKYNAILDDIMKSKSVGLDIKVKHKEMFFYGVPTKNNEIGFINSRFKMNGINTIS